MLLGGSGDAQPPIPDKARWSTTAVDPAPGVRLRVTSATAAWASVCRKSQPKLTAGLSGN